MSIVRIRSLVLCAALFTVTACTSKAIKNVAVPPQTNAQGQKSVAPQTQNAVARTMPNSTPRPNRPRIDEVYPAKFDANGRGSVPRSRRGRQGKGNINLDFKDADLRQVIGTILGDLLKFNYLIDQKVAGTVTLVAKQQVRRDELLPILDTILAARGFALFSSYGPGHRHSPPYLTHWNVEVKKGRGLPDAVTTCCRGVFVGRLRR